MKTISINTYDPGNRLDMSDEEAEKFYQYVEAQAEARGFKTVRVSNLSVDEDSERFNEKCFINYE